MRYLAENISLQVWRACVDRVRGNFKGAGRVHSQHYRVTDSDAQNRTSLAITMEGHSEHPGLTTRQVIQSSDTITDNAGRALMVQRSCS